MATSTINLENASVEETRDFLDSFDIVLSDCDGEFPLSTRLISILHRHLLLKFFRYLSFTRFVTMQRFLNSKETVRPYALKLIRLVLIVAIIGNYVFTYILVTRNISIYTHIHKVLSVISMKIFEYFEMENLATTCLPIWWIIDDYTNLTSITRCPLVSWQTDPWLSAYAS